MSTVTAEMQDGLTLVFGRNLVVEHVLAYFTVLHFVMAALVFKM